MSSSPTKRSGCSCAWAAGASAVMTTRRAMQTRRFTEPVFPRGACTSKVVPASLTLFADELLAIGHVRPNEGLEVRLHLPEVVAVVVDPLLEQVLDLDIAHLFVRPTPFQVRRGQA